MVSEPEGERAGLGGGVPMFASALKEFMLCARPCTEAEEARECGEARRATCEEEEEVRVWVVGWLGGWLEERRSVRSGYQESEIEGEGERGREKGRVGSGDESGCGCGCGSKTSN